MSNNNLSQAEKQRIFQNKYRQPIWGFCRFHRVYMADLFSYRERCVQCFGLCRKPAANRISAAGGRRTA